MGAGGALAPPEFGVSEKRTERETDSPLLSAPPDLKPNDSSGLLKLIHYTVQGRRKVWKSGGGG